MKFKKTLIGDIPIHWKVMTLKECTEKITDGTHSTVKDNPDGEYYLLSCKNIKDGNILLGANERKIDYETLIKLRKRTGLKKDDILLTTVGTIGESAIVEEEIIDYEFQRSVAIIRCNTEMILPKFMYYLTKSKKFLAQAEGRVSGSVQKCLFLNGISEISIPLPPIDEQEKIICILDCIENKIKINNEMNRTLEEIAQALFKRWFVDFEFPNEEGKPYKSSGGEMVESEMGLIPKGWNSMLISELIEVKDGTHASPKPKEEGYALITSKHISGEKIDFNSANLISKEDYNEVNKRSKVNTGDILISMIGTVGLIHLVQEEQINFAIKNVGLLKSSQKRELSEYLYLFLNSKQMKNYIESRLAGTTQKYISLGELRKIKFILPNEKIIAKFNNVLKSIFKKKRSNINEVETLIKIRDSLLPKLMSGEIRVNDIEANL